MGCRLAVDRTALDDPRLTKRTASLALVIADISSPENQNQNYSERTRASALPAADPTPKVALPGTARARVRDDSSPA
jgi:hypothetical protein